MIHIVIGTKAQLIKMAPVIKGFESRGIPYNFINLGQHAATVGKLSKQFGIQSEGLGTRYKEDVTSLFGIIKWVPNLLVPTIFRPKYLKEKIFQGSSGLVLIHGDTLSTLIGLLMAKRVGGKVVHVESGLRSWNYLNPFPEELIRVVCMKFSDFLFAPSTEAVDILKGMNVKGMIFNTVGNTGTDAVKMVLRGQVAGIEKGTNSNREGKPYVLVSIHRFENLYSGKRLRFIIDTVDRISRDYDVVFVMHGPTERRLKKKGVFGKLTPHSGRITYLPLQDYPDFLKLIVGSEFVVTDGGSVQEECFYLGKPCLIMRKRTERPDGVEESAILAKFDKAASDMFINNYQNFKREAASIQARPSEVVVDEILRL